METRLEAAPTPAERTLRIAMVALMALAFVVLAFGVGFFFGDQQGGDSTTPNSTAVDVSDQAGVSAATIDEICTLLEKQYVDRDTIDPDTCRQAAITGLLTSLNDPHTSFLTQAELEAGALELNSSYQGIGASVSDTSGQVTIVAPFRESPAEAAGIQAGDVILEVDGEMTDGWSDQQAVQKIRGAAGTKVSLKVKHLDGKIETLSITRGDIEIESVFLEPLIETIPGESGVKIVDRSGAEVTDLAYVNVAQFHENTLNELRTKLQGLESKGYKGLIIDMRGNPGGLLSATVEVADEFLDSGTILSEIDGDGQKETWAARRGGLATKIPVIMLMDLGSASGAEVLAAALRDNGRGKVVGTRSFGKGTVNQLQPLKNCGDPKGCGALYLAVGRWVTPNGDQIEGVGVVPDFEVAMTEDQYVDEGDIQLFKAIEVLRGQ